jgi:xylulose-5-phosphate/fructose-6-phosphate phosphoketolase
MQGHAISNRVGFFISYEAFAPILDSTISQHVKYLQRYNKMKFRGSFASCNYILSSLGWHNCFSHQNPGFIDNLLGRGLNSINIFTPDSLKATIDAVNYMMESSNEINVLLISKISLKLLNHYNKSEKRNLVNWKIYSSKQNNDNMVDIVGIGDCMVEECFGAKKILEEHILGVTFRIISLNRLSILDNPNSTKCLNQFKKVFHSSLFSLWVFLGYPKTIKNLLWNWNKKPIAILGYQDMGQTTTSQGMYIVNGASKYDIALHISKKLSSLELIQKDISDKIELKRKLHMKNLKLYNKDINII